MLADECQLVELSIRFDPKLILSKTIKQDQSSLRRTLGLKTSLQELLHRDPQVRELHRGQ